MKVCIQSCRGTARNYEYDVKPTTTVLELKKRFCQDTNSKEDLHTLCLIFDEEELEEDKKTLSDYSIPDECQLNVVYLGKRYRNQSCFKGSRFLDISNEKDFQRIGWSFTAPPWRKSIRGLCLEGICTNPACEANGQYVIMRIGFKKFDIVSDPDEDTTVCPMCEKFVEPVTIAFNNCWWRYEGKKKRVAGSGKAPVSCSGTWREADDAYHRFDESKDEVVEWVRLIVEVVKDKPI